jgi:alpha/beta superfamily hydrolase
MAESRITLLCGDISLEGISSVPEGKVPLPAVVVCHPHPLYGGMMDNNIVSAVCRALAQASIASLRFNFRGVGGSHISSIGEVDKNRVGLCGYSFGAGVALDVAVKEESVKALALISPILPHNTMLESYARPKLLLWGSDDLALPAVDLKRFTEELPDPKQYKVISGADHMWWGYEDKVGERVASFFAETL